MQKKPLERSDIEPKITPVRGGTDGAQLSYMGLPTPNIFAGGENMHGKYEYVSVETMEKATQNHYRDREDFCGKSNNLIVSSGATRGKLYVILIILASIKELPYDTRINSFHWQFFSLLHYLHLWVFHSKSCNGDFFHHLIF